MNSKALEGIKILEYAQLVSGPYCIKLLADLGADVVKIEPPGNGDEARRRGPFVNDAPHPERSGLFLYLNTNKLGITLNPDSSAGKKVFCELVKWADILVEDNPPQKMIDIGLDYHSLKEINPRLIMTSITPFGQTGPYRDYKGYNLNTEHGSGLAYLTPSAPLDPEILNREPIKSPGFVGDYICGLSAAGATLAALYGLLTMGIGQQVDISKQETLLHHQRTNLSWYCADGVVTDRSTLGGGGAWGGILPTKDGYALVLAPQWHQWQGFVDLMGRPKWTEDERFTVEEFPKYAPEVRPFVMSWAADHTTEEIYRGGQEHDCPFASVYSPAEVLASEHLKARRFFVDIDHPEAGTITYPSAPCRFSKTPWHVERPAPLLGQHNEEVYCHRLGYSHDDLVRMRQAGVI